MDYCKCGSLRLVKCKKCGATVLSETTLLENMYLALQECNEKARKANKASVCNNLTQEAIQIRKMIVQILHRTSQLEDRKTTVICELSEIVHYITENKLVSFEILDELREKARSKAEIKNKQDEDAIKKIYGDFENLLANRSKLDPTANKAIGAIRAKERRGQAKC